MPKPGDIKEDDLGKLVWRQPENCHEGWWTRIEEDWVVESRTPLNCPACNLLLDNWSASFYNRWGVCSDCYYDHLEGRENLPEFQSNKDRSAYCKQKAEEKSSIK